MKNSGLIQAVKFTLFSISAGAIELLASLLLYDILHINYWVSYLTALLLSVIWNFTFNRKFTFKSANNVPFAMFLVLCFYAVFTPASTWWGAAMEKRGVPGILVTVISMLINFVTEFFYQKYVVFREPKLSEDELTHKKIIKILQEEF